MNKMLKQRFAIKKEDGQSLVEAALVLPLLLLLLCGILDFGWIFAHQIMINNTSRDAVRYAVVNYDNENLQYLVASKIQGNEGMGGGADIVVTVVKKESGDIEVSVSKDIKVLTPLAGIFVSDQTVTIKSVSIMWAG
jgi:Flp pilus assembly protein TadG